MSDSVEEKASIQFYGRLAALVLALAAVGFHLYQKSSKQDVGANGQVIEYDAWTHSDPRVNRASAEFDPTESKTLDDYVGDLDVPYVVFNVGTELENGKTQCGACKQLEKPYAHTADAYFAAFGDTVGFVKIVPGPLVAGEQIVDTHQEMMKGVGMFPTLGVAKLTDDGYVVANKRGWSSANYQNELASYLAGEGFAADKLKRIMDQLHPSFEGLYYSVADPNRTISWHDGDFIATTPAVEENKRRLESGQGYVVIKYDLIAPDKGLFGLLDDQKNHHDVAVVWYRGDQSLEDLGVTGGMRGVLGSLAAGTLPLDATSLAVIYTPEMEAYLQDNSTALDKLFGVGYPVHESYVDGARLGTPNELQGMIYSEPERIIPKDE